MMIRVTEACNCPCNDGDGFCKAMRLGDLVCCGKNPPPEECPAREGLGVRITIGIINA